MAQDPKQYRSRGYTLESQTPLRFTSLQEATRASQTLSARLDRISDFAFEKMTQEAERKGKMFGVQNRPTLEQISIAVQNDQDINELLAEPGTVQGDAARAVQAQMLKQDLLNDLTARFSDIDQQIEAGMLSKSDVITEMNAAIEGYSRIIGQVDPDQELKFRASASTVGFQSVAKANAYEIKQRKIQHADMSGQLLDRLDDYVQTVVTNDQNPASLKATLLEREAQAQQFFSQDQDTYFDNMTKYREVEKKAVMNHIAKEIASKGTIIEFGRGNVDEFLPLLVAESLNTDDDRKAIMKIALDQEDSLNKALDTEKKTKQLLTQDFMTDLYIKFKRNDLTAEAYIDQARAKGIPLSNAAINEVMNNQMPSIDQENNYGTYEAQLYQGKLNRTDINKAVRSGKLLHKQGEELKKVHRDITTKHSDAFTKIKGIFKVDSYTEVQLDKNKALRNVISRANSRYITEAQQALAEDKPFAGIQRAEEIAKEEFNAYNDEIVGGIEEKVIEDFNLLNMPYERNKFLNMTTDEIGSLTGSDGKKISASIANRIYAKQKKMIKSINTGLDID